MVPESDEFVIHTSGFKNSKQTCSEIRKEGKETRKERKEERNARRRKQTSIKTKKIGGMFIFELLSFFLNR